MKYILSLLTILLPYILLSQSDFDFNHYPLLKHKGEKPNGIVLHTEKLVFDYFEKSGLLTSNSRRNKIKKYLENSNYTGGAIGLRESLLINDPISAYLNKIKDVLLKDDPELKDEINIYVSRAASVNAGMLINGTMVVNLGLVARATSEAELAYIIAHEIAHYKLGHHVQKFLQNYDVIRTRSKEQKYDYEYKLKSILGYSRTKEYEADSLGAMYFFNSAYHLDGITETFNTLRFDHTPIKEVEFDKAFFDVDAFKIPREFFLEKVDPIKVKQFGEDTYRTHPNVDARKDRLTWEIEQRENTDRKRYLVSEEEFKIVQTLARFEEIDVEYHNEDFCSAIYNAYILLQEYPESEYLNVTIGKSLFQLSTYKTNNEFFKTTRFYNWKKGESQQVHYLLKKLSKKQLNALAIVQLHKLKGLYPDNPAFEKMETSLWEDMLVKNKITKEFLLKEHSEIKVNPEETASLSGNDLKRFYARKYRNFYARPLSQMVKTGVFDTYIDSIQE